MAQNQQTISCPSGVWTQLTNNSVTAITFQPLSGDVFIRFMTNTTTPTEAHGIIYKRGQGELQKALTGLTNLSGAAYVWAKPVDTSGSVTATAAVYVDHA